MNRIQLTKSQINTIGSNLWVKAHRVQFMIWALVSVFGMLPFVAAKNQWWSWFVFVPVISFIICFIWVMTGTDKSGKAYEAKYNGYLEEKAVEEQHPS